MDRPVHSPGLSIQLSLGCQFKSRTGPGFVLLTFESGLSKVLKGLSWTDSLYLEESFCSTERFEQLILSCYFKVEESAEERVKESEGDQKHSCLTLRL